MQSKSKTYPFPIKRNGIIGGGQLGKMLIQKAITMGFYTMILEESSAAPATGLADKQLVGHLYERDKLIELVTSTQVCTYEIEHVGIDELDPVRKAFHPLSL